YFPITVRFSPMLAAFSAGVSFLTVLAAALIPAVKIAGMTPLEAIHMPEGSSAGKKKDRKKYKKHPIFRKLFGYAGELAAASHYVNRKRFRAGVLSLTLCLMLLCGFVSLMGMNNYLSIRNRQAAYYNIYARLTMITESDRKLPGELLAIAGQQENVYFCVSRMAYWAQPSQETEEFKSRGGFAGLNREMWNLVERDGKYRIQTYLYGMEEKAFDAYCKSLGGNPAEYYDTEHIKALAWSAAPLYPEVLNNRQKSIQSYSHLKLLPGQKLLIEEKTEDDMDTDYKLPVEVGAVAAKGPEIGDVRNNYSINLYVPLKVYYAIAEGFGPDKAQSAYSIYVKMKTSPENDLAVAERAEEICRSFMPEEDFYIVSAAREERDNAVAIRAMGAVVDCIGILLGLIGISNTLSVVSRSMMGRRREFAMLRSVGMDTQGIGKLLLLEGLRMALTPVLAAVPGVAALLAALMWIVDVTWKELLPYIPWGK
ncbi:MAG: ABC transporter permease, partial [Lachnospiraceae bacterium]|nr:ABC transporter permease [Lachnospiraceae bacterium]